MRLEYDNSTALMAVIGDPIAHSLSPLLQNAILQQVGENAIYVARNVRRVDLPAWVAAVKVADITAFNATMPHKLDLVDLVDELTEDARFYGAVNSVKKLPDGRLVGHNTDGSGFARALEDLGTGFAGKTVVLLGAGGAASSIALRAVQDGAKAVYVRNRTLARAELLCSRFPAVMHPQTMTDPFPDADIVVSSLALDGAKTLDLSFVAGLRNDCVVCDILYSPPRTPLLQAAEDRGLKIDNGLNMLIYQAIFAQEFYLDRPLDAAALAAHLRTVVSQNKA
jgi:shikimate dehydrogenase